VLIEPARRLLPIVAPGSAMQYGLLETREPGVMLCQMDVTRRAEDPRRISPATSSICHRLAAFPERRAVCRRQEAASGSGRGC
jgi:hypothetical protein